MLKVEHKTLCENCFSPIESEPCPVCGFHRDSYQSDPMALGAGSLLAGRYAIGRVIGKGGFGVTYLAYDMKLECRVAVKEYYPRGLAVRTPGTTAVSVSNMEEAETFQSGAAKFYDEARLVSKFNGNPNIVSVYDVFYENDTVYFIMGYLEGRTLKDYLKECGALPLEQALYVAEAVSNALMAAHSMNVLHRDISPDNIMVCTDGTVKLLDFGAARQVVTEGSQSFSVILKQGFAPLEQYQKKGKQGPWTDIYSLGATLYHALTLDTLDDPMSRLDDDGEYHSNKYHIQDELWHMIKKATSLKIQDRYQDIFEWKSDLNRLSIKPVPLVEVRDLDARGRFGSAVSASGNTVHTAPGSGAARAADEVGVTMPLREEAAVGVTVPLQEEATVGVTMPLREKETVGVTMPLREEAVGAAEPLRKKAPEGSKPLWEENRTGAAEPLQKAEVPNTLQRAELSEETEGRKNKHKSKIVGIVGIAAAIVAAVVIGIVISINTREFRYEEYDNYIVITEYLRDDSVVTIPSKIKGKSVTEIAFYIFSDCENVTTVKIPESVTSIEGAAFDDCGLVDIEVAEQNSNYASYNGCLYSKDLTELIRVPENKSKVIFSEHITSIGDYAFYACSNLTSIEIPDSVLEIGEGAFADCSSLTSIEIPDSVLEVGDRAFRNCSNLIEVVLPAHTIIQEDTFKNCDNVEIIRKGGEDQNVMMEDPRFAYIDLDSMDEQWLTADYEAFSAVFGNHNFNRSDIKKITFLNTKKGAPSDAWDVSKAHNGDVMAWIEKGDHLYIAANGLIIIQSAGYLFDDYKNVEEIEFNDCVDTSQADNMKEMFSGCSSLDFLDVSCFDTSQVTDMSYMFHGCTQLKSLDLSNFDTSQVTNMNSMFEYCRNLTSLDVSSFDTSQVWNMNSMFDGCFSLTSLDVSGFDISQVTNMYDMFEGAGITAEEAGLSQ